MLSDGGRCGKAKTVAPVVEDRWLTNTLRKRGGTRGLGGRPLTGGKVSRIKEEREGKKHRSKRANTLSSEEKKAFKTLK